MDQWIDSFILMTMGYALTSFSCLVPTVMCRAKGEMEYRTVHSKQTTILMEEFKTTMGAQNYHIFNMPCQQAEILAEAEQEEARI